jgi:hypothetical protein
MEAMDGDSLSVKDAADVDDLEDKPTAEAETPSAAETKPDPVSI